MNIHLTRTPTASTACPAAETALSHVDGESGELIIAGERVGNLAGNIELRGRHRAAVDGGDRTADQRGAKSAPPSATRASARSRGCPTCCPRRDGLSDRRRLARGDRRPARRARARPRSDHRRRDSGDRRRAGAARRRADKPVAPDAGREPCRRHAVDAARPDADRRAGGRARRLSRHRLRPRHERLDLHRARHRLDAGRPVLRGHRRLLRADRPAAWRRAGAGAGNARCDRHAREASSRGSTRRWRAGSG